MDGKHKQNKMEIHLKINVEELLGKSKELDLGKTLKLWKELQNGEEIKFLDGNIKLQQVEEKKVDIPDCLHGTKKLKEAMNKSLVEYGDTSRYGEFLK